MFRVVKHCIVIGNMLIGYAIETISCRHSECVSAVTLRETFACWAKFNTLCHHDSPFLILNILQAMFERSGGGIVL